MFNSLYFVAAFLITLAAHRYWTRRAEHAAATTLPEKNHQATTSNRSTHTKGDKAPGIKQQTQITADGFFRPDPMPPVDLEHAMTRNYLYGRGLRYPMHMGMAHSSLHPNHWLEIDYEYEYYLKRTKDLMDRFGNQVVDCLPEASEGCGELLAHIVDYLPRRFPHWFTAEKHGIVNKVTGKTFTGISTLKGIDALKVAAQLSQGDYLIANQKEDGKWYFTAALSALPGWKGGIPAKMGMSMFDTHDPVPDFNKQLLKSVERTFTRIAPDQPFEREAVFLSTDTDVWLDSKKSGIPLSADFWDGQDFRIRISHQNIRKLPKTNTIIFHIHTAFYTITDLRSLPGVPRMAKESIGGMNRAELEFFGMLPMLDIVFPALDRLHEEQLKNGLLKNEDDWKIFKSLIPEDQPIPHVRTPWEHQTESQKRRAALEQS